MCQLMCTTGCGTVQPPKPVIKPVVKAPVKPVKVVKASPVKKPVAPESSDDDEDESSDEVLMNPSIFLCLFLPFALYAGIFFKCSIA